jgi:hypothetical protein
LFYTSWPPTEAAIHDRTMILRVTLDGRVKPGHDVKSTKGRCPLLHASCGALRWNREGGALYSDLWQISSKQQGWRKARRGRWRIGFGRNRFPRSPVRITSSGRRVR